MKKSGGNRTPLEITALTGKFYQTSFEYADHRFWIGADYYQVPGGYQVSYKVGLVESWFATSADFAVPVMYDEIINCTAADIENIILRNIEEKKTQAAEQCLDAAYAVKFYFHEWAHNGNDAFLAKFKDALPYVNHNGACDSILFQLAYRAILIYLYCHVDAMGKIIQILGTDTDLSFVKVKEIPIPDQYAGNYVDLISEHLQSIEDVIDVDNIVRTLRIPVGLGARMYRPSEQHPEEMELKLWPD